MRSQLTVKYCVAAVLMLAAVLQMSAMEIVNGRANDLLVTKWTTEDGLPQNTVTSVVQTRDGYIWLGTFGGLARFDGIKFTVFDPVSVNGLDSNRILSLFEDSRGFLWIGTETGEIYVQKDGVFKKVDGGFGTDRVNVWGFEEDIAGRIYVTSHSGLERIEVTNEEGSRLYSITAIAEGEGYLIGKDAGSRIWVRMDGKFKYLEGDRLVDPGAADSSIPEWSINIGFGNDDTVLAGTQTSLELIRGNESQEILKLDIAVHEGGFAITSHDSAFWFQQAGEIYEIIGGRMARYDISKHMARGSREMLFDREGNIWLATRADGLVRVSKRRVGLISDITGEVYSNVYSLVEDNEGTVWFANNTLFKLADRKVTEISSSNTGPKPVVRSLAIDKAGNVWAGSATGLYKVETGMLVAVPEVGEKDIKALMFDRDGDLWVGAQDGFGIYSNGKYAEFKELNDVSGDGVHCFYQGSDGTVWIGTRHGLLGYRDRKLKRYGEDEGLSTGFVRDIYEDRDGVIWVATYGGGLYRLKEGEIASITEAHGLRDNALSRILVDRSDRFWLLSNFGIHRVSRSDLNNVADGMQNFLGGAVYGTADGMISSEANGGIQPAGMVSRDGRLWFPMLKDVVIIDPDRGDSLAPIVKIESASSRSSAKETPRDPLVFDPGKVIQIENGLRNLEISYTGLSYTKPESLRFFYKLEGLDEDWIDAGSRRTAFYPYLPPGSYRFTVKALGTNGLWSEQTAELRIQVAQRFWESRWFALLLVILAAGAGVLFYRSRVRRHEERQNAQKEFAKRLISAHEHERRRMAAELHDGLGQNLLLIKNWASMAMKEPASGGASEFLSKISDSVAESLEETRSIVQDLSPQNLRRFGLTDAIVSMVEQLEDATELIIETDIHDIDGVFSDEAEISIFRIVQEALTNIVKHSECDTARISITRNPGIVRVAVSDDGKGFVVREGNASPGGFGLMGITQRVNLLGGEAEINSAPGEGTSIVITLRYSDENHN